MNPGDLGALREDIEEFSGEVLHCLRFVNCVTESEDDVKILRVALCDIARLRRLGDDVTYTYARRELLAARGRAEACIRRNLIASKNPVPPTVDYG